MEIHTLDDGSEAPGRTTLIPGRSHWLLPAVDAEPWFPPLLGPHGDVGTWARARRRIRARFLGQIGDGPGAVPPQVRWAEDEPVGGGVIRTRIEFSVADGDSVGAFVFRPESRRTRLPAILALHGTNAFGKDVTAGIRGKPDQAYGLELAQRGYVVLAPDEFCAAIRSDDDWDTSSFYRRYPAWSAIGKMLLEHRAAISILRSLPFVSPTRIGAIGHSLGGYNAYWLHGLDRRVRVAVVSCGFQSLSGDHEPTQWSRREWFVHLPRLRRDLERGTAPFEWHEILALGAPRPQFVWLTRGDEIFPHWEWSTAALARVEELYTALGVPDRFRLLVGEGGHAFQLTARLEAYAFLDRWLAGRPSRRQSTSTEADGY